MKFSKVWILVAALLLSPRLHSQQGSPIPEIVKDGVRYYAPTQPFFNLQCVGPLCPSGSGTNGFPFTLGATPIAAGSTVNAVNGLSVNGVTLQHGGSATAFLNAAGGYSGVGGSSVAIKYMSVNGCPQNSDPNAGGGTDATACINALFAAATPTNPVAVIQDAGFSLISGNGILCPTKGNCILAGEGGGIAKTLITACAISGGTATLTAQNSLSVGATGTFSQLTNCPTLNNATATVTSATATQFTVAFGGSVASGAEANGWFTQAYGTGFFLQAGSRDLFSNGPWGTGSVCEVPASTPNPRGANVQITNLVLNGNAPNQGNYCFGVDLDDLEGVTIRDVIFYNASKYSLKMGNVGHITLDSNTYFSTTAPVGTNTDGVHIDGPANDVTITNSKFHTSDDAIALNSIEGNCGGITRVTIADNTFENAFTAMRMYNEDQNVCANGLSPLISYIDWNNNNGTIAGHPFQFGLGNPPYFTGTLNPAIDHVHISNSTFTSQAGGGSNAPFNVEENVGDMTVSNFTLIGPNFGPMFSFGSACTLGQQYMGRIELNNITVANTAAGSNFTTLLNDSGCVTYQSLTLRGFGTTWNGATPVTQGPLFNGIGGTSTMGELMMSDIDPANITVFPNSVSSWLPSHVANVFAPVPGGLTTTAWQTYGSAAPLNAMSLGGQMTTPNGGVGGSSNCNFGGSIAPWACGTTVINGATVYYPLQHP